MNPTNYKSFSSNIGLVELYEYRPPFSNAHSAIALEQLVHVNIRDDELRKNWLEDIPASLKFMIDANIMIQFIIAKVNGEFSFFSAARISPDTDEFIFFARAFSNSAHPKNHINLAYVMPMHIDLAKELGYKSAFFCLNVGLRDTVVKSIMHVMPKMLNSRNDVKKLAAINSSKLQYDGIRIVNYSTSHIFRCPIDQN